LIRKIDVIIKEIEKMGAINGMILESLVQEYGDRFWRALRAVGEHAVNKYIFQPSGQVAWIVVGKSREYLISLEDKYCPCDDFYLNVVLKKKFDVCYHILAKMLAVSLNIYNEYKVEDERYPDLIEEWKDIS